MKESNDDCENTSRKMKGPIYESSNGKLKAANEEKTHVHECWRAKRRIKRCRVGIDRNRNIKKHKREVRAIAKVCQHDDNKRRSATKKKIREDEDKRTPRARKINK